MNWLYYILEWCVLPVLSSDTQSYYAEYIHIVHFYVILMNRFSVIGWVSYIMGSKAIGAMSFPYYLLIILMYFLHQSLNCKPYRTCSLPYQINLFYMVLILCFFSLVTSLSLPSAMWELTIFMSQSHSTLLYGEHSISFRYIVWTRLFLKLHYPISLIIIYRFIC